MTKIYLLISLVILLFVNVCWCQCRWANWQGSFDRAGWSKCGSTTEYLTGFYRNSKSASDPIHLLDKGNCCNAPAPNQNRASTCQNANWWRQLDRNNEWAFCPTGYFLQGLYRTSNHNIHNIEEGRCCKPNNLPNSYLHCYTHDVSKSFDNKGWSKCDSQYYLRGFYREGCDKLHCIDQFQCCMMYNGCKFANWWKSFDRKGWAQCDSKQYITGLWRNVNLGSRDQIYLLEEAKCCSAPAPFQNVQSTCREANWWSVLDKTNTWAVCPLGYFLRGFYRNDGAWLHHIELGKCCKPNTFPDRYEDCYTENVRISFDKRGLSQCKRRGYYLAGIYKGGCDKLFCIESFKCCRMNIDECRIKNPCLKGAVCSDQPGSYKCTCKSGYRGKNCENDVNECVNNPCKNRAACVNLKGSYRCDCKFGYIGENCQIDINECTNNPCKNRANCVNLKGNYRCDCKAGYTGKNCETDVNECATTPCKNGDACVNLPGSYRCHCKSGFTGKKCETDVNECNKNPCNNGAACVNLKGSYRCDCKSGYSGKHCESDVDECTTTPCKNGAACINLPGSYRCDCNSGYTGKHCESDINECQNKPCKNRAACVNLPGTYRCDCTPGYTGKNCETDVDECANTPCKNRAVCVNLPGSYHCNCKSGFTGSNCETDINECANKPCKNGAACINLSGTYRCNCKSGYIGKHCETDINECNNNPCKNGATCVNLPGSYRCNCTLKFRGTRCDILAAPTDQCED